MLLDTHVLVWLALGDSSLGKNARASIEAALRALDGAALAVSAISFWEIGMLQGKGHLTLDPTVARRRSIQSGIVEIPIDGMIAIRAAGLEAFHGDPADRIIVASALASDWSLVTADRAILKWKRVRTIDATN